MRKYVLTMLIVLGMYGPAQAHGLGVECKLTKEHVEVEAYYDDDTVARHAKVEVKDEYTEVVAQGRTDAQGLWKFSRPKAGKYVVVVDAGAGHRAKVKITVPEETPAATATSAAPTGDDCGCCEEEGSISDGSSRQDFTRVPWERLGLGLLVIGALAGVFWLGKFLGR